MFLVALTLRYDDSRLPNNMDESTLQLYELVAGTWRLVRHSTVDHTANTVRGFIRRGGTYAVRSTPVARVQLVGAVVGGALYVGQTTQLSVRLRMSMATN